MFSAAVGRVRAAVAPSDAPDAVLVARFARTRCPDAFAALVKRHGPAVLAACRRVTGCPHLADDAFQAAFLVLARRAADVRPAAAVGAFLHGVAVRTAQDARSMAARRRARETPTSDLPDPPAPPAPDTEALALLDAEVARLPDHLRTAVVLCELEGRPRAEVANALGIPDGTLSSRLAKARKLLAERLRKRGVGPPAAVLATAFVPAELAAQTAGLAAGSGAVSARVAELTDKVVKAMFLKKLKAAAVVLALGLTAGGLLLTAARPARSDEPAKAKAQAAKPKPADPGALLVWQNTKFVTVTPDGKPGGPDVSFEKDKILTDEPVFSPDGTRLAFVAHEDPPTDDEGRHKNYLLVRAADGSPGRTRIDVNANFVAWTPDGKALIASELVYAKEPKDITFLTWKIDPASGEKAALDLPKMAQVYAPMPDGKGYLAAVWELAEPLDKSKFWLAVVSADGTEKLTELRTEGPRPKASPDGSKVLFQDRDPAETGEEALPRLFVYDRRAKTRTRLAEVPENADLHGFCWSPDGRRVAYVWKQAKPGVPRVLNAENPDLAKKAQVETESFLVVADADGRNPKTVLSEKAESAASVTLWAVAWRK